MPRIRSVAAAASTAATAATAAVNRRTLLAATGAVSLSAGIGFALRFDSAAYAAIGHAPAVVREAPIVVFR